MSERRGIIFGPGGAHGLAFERPAWNKVRQIKYPHPVILSERPPMIAFCRTKRIAAGLRRLINAPKEDA